MADLRMHGKIVNDEDVIGHNRERKEPVAEKPLNLKLVLWLIVAALVVLIVWEIILQVVIMPGLRIRTIEFSGDPVFTKERFLELTGLEAEPLWFHVDEQALRERIELIATVRTAQVEKRFPDTLLITVESRKPLVQALLASESSMVLIDVDGVAYEKAVPGVAWDLPVLSGIEFRDFQVGTKLPSFMGAFLRDLDELRVNAAALFRAFSEFRIIPQGDQDVEILVYSVERSVPVRISSHIDTQSATYILRVLRMLGDSRGFGSIKEIDFRSRDVIVKKGDE